MLGDLIGLDGAAWAARMRGRTRYQVLAVLLVLIAGVVAGDKLLIPTLVLLFGVDIRLADSLSLAVKVWRHTWRGGRRSRPCGAQAAGPVQHHAGTLRYCSASARKAAGLPSEPISSLRMRATAGVAWIARSACKNSIR